MSERIRMTPDVVETFGGEAVMRKRIEDFVKAKDQHRFTVDVPAPVEHGLIEAIAARGGWEAAAEIVTPPEPEPEPEGLPPAETTTAEQALLKMPLPAAVAAAERVIDMTAEHIRATYITPGAGQAMEYLRTEFEAQMWQREQSLDLYPMLKAEADAIEQATGVRPADGDVVSSVLANAEAWATIGAAIKRERRARKIRITAATTVEDIYAIVTAPWSVTPE